MNFFVFIAVGTLLLALIESYFIRKGVKAAQILLVITPPDKIKLSKIIFLILVNIYPVFLFTDWGYSAITHSDVYVPQSSFFDYVILYPFWFLIIVVIQCDLLFLFIDAVKAISYPVWKKHKEKIKSFETKLIAALIIFFIVYVPLRIVCDYNAVSIRIVEYKKKNLPGVLNNFKIALISDIHADRYTNAKRLNNYIDKVNSTNPDLVLIGGDFITSSPDYINEAAKYIGMIKSKYGIYSCVGDHDNWAYRHDYHRSLAEVEDALQKKNVEMLDNTEKKVAVGSVKIGIIFITNTYVSQVPRKILDSLTSALDSVDLKILLVHQPRKFIVKEGVKKKYDLMLAGHTHGGQLTFLFPFINLTPTLIETPYIRGNFHFGKTLLVVTRGLGMSLAPVRYNSTPEITVIVLEKK
jgi:uncharacterized protein